MRQICFKNLNSNLKVNKYKAGNNETAVLLVEKLPTKTSSSVSPFDKVLFVQ